MSFTQLTLTTRRPLDLGASKSKPALRKFANLLQGALSGSNAVDGWLLHNSGPDDNTASASARALAGFTFATGTGTVGSIINGTSVTATWATSDTATSAALVTAINANTTVNPLVMASKYFGKVTLATCIAGDAINICGYTFTGVAGTANYQKGQFSIDTDDTAAALDLTKAIQSTHGLNQKIAAVSAAGVVYLPLVENRAARSDETISSSQSTFTIVAITTGAAYFVVARQPGLLGNACTATATGTNLTAISAVSGKLGGGRGGYLSTGQYVSSDTR